MTQQVSRNAHGHLRRRRRDVRRLAEPRKQIAWRRAEEEVELVDRLLELGPKRRNLRPRLFQHRSS